MAGLIALAAEHGGRDREGPWTWGAAPAAPWMALRRAGFTAAGIDPSRGMMEIAAVTSLGGDGADLVVGGLPELPPGAPPSIPSPR